MQGDWGMYKDSNSVAHLWVSDGHPKMPLLQSLCGKYKTNHPATQEIWFFGENKHCKHCGRCEQMRVEIEFESNESGRIRVDLESEKASNARALIDTAVNAVENELNSIHTQSYGG